MRLLLDTHVFLWVAAGSPKLRAAARDLIDAADEIFVSAASIWEIAIKVALGKFDADPRALAGSIHAIGFRDLPVRASHAAAVVDLPLLHHDPFDRILVAQAAIEPLRLLTADSVLTRYGDYVTLV